MNYFEAKFVRILGLVDKSQKNLRVECRWVVPQIGRHAPFGPFQAQELVAPVDLPQSRRAGEDRQSQGIGERVNAMPKEYGKVYSYSALYRGRLYVPVPM